MEVVWRALEQQRPIRLHSADSSAVAALLPVKRGAASLALGAEIAGEAQTSRYLRILQGGQVDLHGSRNGQWTEFGHEPGEGSSDGEGVLFLRGVGSGRWLSVSSGEFASSERPVPLVPELAGCLERTAPGGNAGAEGQRFVRLTSGGRALQWPVRLSRVGAHAFLATEAGGNVAVGPQGRVHCLGKEGKWARWTMEEISQGIAFKNVGHGAYLAMSPEGAARLSESPVAFAVEPIDSPWGPSEPPPIDAAVLSAEDLAVFRRDGYIVVRGAVPPELVRDALRTINHQLGKPGCWQPDPDPLNAAQLNLKLPSEGVGRDVISRSPVLWSVVNVLLGAGNVEPCRGCQVALRFPAPPEAGHEQPDSRPGTRYHIDGMGKNRLCPFSLLCGVALSEQSRPEAGNLHVFPGSHLHEGLRRYYRDKIDDICQSEADDRKPDLGRSLQVLLRPGDAVVAHQLLAHRIGVNTSEHIRYQLYYRVSHRRHEELKHRVVDDPWVEYAI